jgi:hypothetical protein
LGHIGHTTILASFPRQKIVGTVLGDVSYFSLVGNCIVDVDVYFPEGK